MKALAGVARGRSLLSGGIFESILLGEKVSVIFI